MARDLLRNREWYVWRGMLRAGVCGTRLWKPFGRFERMVGQPNEELRRHQAGENAWMERTKWPLRSRIDVTKR
eukprot:8580149-Pyramimonas_sp.AAC.2